MDWLDEGIPPNEEGRETTHDDDGTTSLGVSRRTSNTTQEKDIDSQHKGKALKIVSSSSSSDDGDNGSSRWGVALVGVVEEVVALVRVLEVVVVLVVIMLVKQILTCHGCRPSILSL